jgi:Alpha-L-arabinofuranosidase B, catalytic
VAVESQGTTIYVNNLPINGVIAIRDVRSGSAAEIDTTTLQSNAKQFDTGLKDEGSMTLDVISLVGDPGQQNLLSLRNNRVAGSFVIEMQTEPLFRLMFSGLVTTFTFAAAVDDVIRGSVTVRITGAISEGFEGVLDSIATVPTGAWSVARVLASEHSANPLIRLRRSSDNAEQDIGHAEDGMLDAAAATAFLGGSSGFIVTVYDQVGNNDLVAPADANEPEYSATGLGGRPCGDLNGTTHYWASHGLAALFSGADKPLSVVMATHPDSFITTGHAFWGLGRSTTATPFFGLFAGSAQVAFREIRRDDANVTVTAHSSTEMIEDIALATVFPGTTVSCFLGRNVLNGMSAVAYNVGTMTVDRFAVGSVVTTSAGSFFDGKIAEVVLFDVAVPAGERLAISDSQQAFYNMKVTGVLAAAAQQQLPDALGGDPGEGFTCTGLAHDPVDNAWWVGNDGRNVLADVTFQPSLVKLSIDGSTKLAELDMGALFALNNSIQGVAYDTTDDSIWFASPSENLIRHVSKAGANLANHISKTAPNGLCYDSLRDALWYTSGTNLFRISKAGTLQDTVALGVAELDHLFYDVGRDLVWYSYGGNGVPGNVKAYKPTTAATTHFFRLPSAQAVEGISILGSTLYVCHDGYFHNVAPLENQLQTYTVSLT